MKNLNRKVHNNNDVMIKKPFTTEFCFATYGIETWKITYLEHVFSKIRKFYLKPQILVKITGMSF